MSHDVEWEPLASEDDSPAAYKPRGPKPAAPRVIHADAEILVIDKPAGVLSVPGRGAHPLLADLLRSGNSPLGRVAEQVGYESEQAFNRAFKREFGVPPARWRRRDEHAAPASPQ